MKVIQFTDSTYIKYADPSENTQIISSPFDGAMNGILLTVSDPITGEFINTGSYSKIDTAGNNWLITITADDITVKIGSQTISVSRGTRPPLFMYLSYNPANHNVRISGRGSVYDIIYTRNVRFVHFTIDTNSYSADIQDHYEEVADYYGMYGAAVQNKCPLNAALTYKRGGVTEKAISNVLEWFGSSGVSSGAIVVDLSAAIQDEPAPEPEDTDPFAPGGTSEPGGGNGTFNGTSDSNPIPGDPAISATDTGFMTVFATNVAGLRSLANSLWTDLFSAIQPGGTLEGTVEALKNIVASPYDAILGCHIVPVNVPVGTSRNVKMYGVLPSTVSLPVASSQWVHKDCGSLTIAPYDGSYLDYAPYSKVTSLYLPFVGVVSVDIDIIMNTTIGVYYKIDIVSGQCIVYVTKDNNVYFQYQGQCAVPIPVTSIDWSNTVNAGLGLIGSVTNIVGSAVGGAMMGGPAGALSGAVTGTIGQAGSMAQNVMNSKPDIKAGSGVGGAAALMGCKSPYLIIERPRKSTPKNQNHYTGYPSNIRAKLGTLEGYTEVSRVYVNHMSATTEEKAEIERLLNDGVVFPKRS